MPEVDLQQLERLVSILGEEINFCREMTCFAQKKQDLIIENQVEELLQLVDEEEEKSEIIQDLEAERMSIFKAIMGDQGTLSDLIARLEAAGEDNWKQRLISVREELLELLFELQSLNERNKVLVEEALTFNQFTMNLLRQVKGSRGQKYNKRGQPLEDDQAGLIDRQV